MFPRAKSAKINRTVSDKVLPIYNKLFPTERKFFPFGNIKESPLKNRDSSLRFASFGMTGYHPSLFTLHSSPFTLHSSPFTLS